MSMILFIMYAPVCNAPEQLFGWDAIKTNISIVITACMTKMRPGLKFARVRCQRGVAGVSHPASQRGSRTMVDLSLYGSEPFF